VQFDAFVESYDQALDRGISVSGEGRDYFAEGRVSFLADSLRALSFSASRVMDFGCGRGTTAPFLIQHLKPRAFLGVDVSEESIAFARQVPLEVTARYESLQEYKPAGDIDLIYSNGTFHHIPPEHRPAALEVLWRALRPGGIFALWENNPWNPGTRYVMSRIPFDRDAVTLSAPEARHMLRAAGFTVRRTNFLFIFPRVLKFLRPLENRLSRLPLGAQYQVLAVKPE
jgi:SAM-dependent methyltransferase